MDTAVVATSHPRLSHCGDSNDATSDGDEWRMTEPRRRQTVTPCLNLILSIRSPTMTTARRSLAGYLIAADFS